MRKSLIETTHPQLSVRRQSRLLKVSRSRLTPAARKRGGGEAAAIWYSLIGSCRAAQVDPFEYLADVMVKVATHPASQVADLVPARWAELRAKTVQG